MGVNSEKTPKKHYVQDMTEILRDAENAQCLILGLTDLQRLPITRDLPSSKESDKVAFWWTSIKGKPLKLF